MGSSNVFSSKRVLIACECSQTSLKIWFENGFDAYSCDIQQSYGEYPTRHIQGDVTPLLKEQWDLIIAHPPCTYLSKLGAQWQNNERWLKTRDAQAFFMLFYNNHNPHICIENPLPMSAIGLPPCSEQIDPYQFGDPYTKRTCLWLKGLSPLMPLYDKPPNCKSWVEIQPHHSDADRQRLRSQSFPGISLAMFNTWKDEI